MQFRLFIRLAFGLALGCFSAVSACGQTAFEQKCAELAVSSAPDAERLHELFKLTWDYRMKESPESATYYGYPGQNHRWQELSLEAIARRKRELHAPLKTLRTIDRSKLTENDRLSYDLFRRDYDEEIEGLRFPEEFFRITQLNGVQQSVPSMIRLMPKFTSADYSNIVARLSSVGTLVDQTIALLEKGLAAGITPPQVTLRDVPQQVMNQLVSDPAKSPVMDALNDFPPGMPVEEQERWRAAATEAVRTNVLPAFERLHRFLTDKYLPDARKAIAMNDLPDGAAWYAFRARSSTTTRLTPREIHEIGLAEVKRIRAEMDRTMKESGFKGSRAEFFEFLRTDPRLFYSEPEELLTGYRDICKRADPELIKLFGTLPRQPYGVIPVPAYAEKSQTTAYYQPGSTSAGRPGYFFANTYNLKSRPKWEMEALSLHEAVPGHHLQLALADELKGVPEFRKYAGYTAYVEGWGLYAESLGYEMGFYRDPYSKFGQLTYEMWRAIRLVVDTGIHSMGWSRQQAIDFFLANSSKAEHDVTVEVDRYIVWPGQALAYKIGQLKIKELRETAQRELGDKFDVRAFHDEVLGHGALPLEVLESQIKEWVRTQKSPARASSSE